MASLNCFLPARTRLVCALLFAVLLSACSGGGDDGPGVTPGAGTGTGTGIGPAIGTGGGTVSGSEAALVVPAGALAQATAIVVTAAEPAASLPEPATLRGRIYTFTPAGTVFAVPATITLPMVGAAAAGEEAVVSWLDTAAGRWVNLPSSVAGDRISAPVEHFTVFTVRHVPRPRLTSLIRWWSLHTMDIDAVSEERMGPDAGNEYSDLRTQAGGAMATRQNFGPVSTFPPGQGPDANAEALSSETGQTYWVRAEAPHPSAAHPKRIGARVDLTQQQMFIKNTANATLKIIVTAASMELIDPIGGPPTNSECPWLAVSNVTNCRRVLTAHTSFWAQAFWFNGQKNLLTTGGTAELNGWQGNWDNEYIYNSPDATVPLWTAANFELERDVDLNGGQRARMRLRAPIVIDVPLGEVNVGDRFSVFAVARANSQSRRVGIDGPGGYASAFFRDPAQTDGVSFIGEGVQEVDPPTSPVPPGAAAGMRACSGGPDPAAGTLHFGSAGFVEPEVAGDGAFIVVTRSGGSRGAVSARLRTADGSGTAGTDYRALDLHVQFADGETGSRVARVAVIGNTVAAPNKTVLLSLSEPGGCASIAEPSTAVLTILDNDSPPAVTPRFTIGGTVTGLQGRGLLLRSRGIELAAASGPFTFPLLLASGIDYEVTVVRQPVGPLQICTVANGRGTVAAAHVTDVRVDCRTPAANGALDPSFGDGGRVSSGLGGGGRKVVLQPDGRILVLGRHTLLRYGADGRLDGSFGNAGQVAVDLGGSAQDEAQGLALQADGHIVVVGSTRVGASDDMAVARYDSQGRLDTSFGNSGRTAIDFNGGADRAWEMLVQPDGRIVIAGHAGVPSAAGTDNDFAAARLTREGRLDTAFGSGGKVTTNIAGRSDLAFAAAPQADGGIVLAGRVAAAGGDFEDFGLVRYKADGRLDPAFGNGGRVRVDFSVNRLGDQALDLVIQPDGRIVVAGFAAAVVAPATLARSVFAIARFLPDGGADGSFGRAGVVVTAFSTTTDFGRAVALQTDGRILVAGQRSNGLPPDFALTRYLADGSLDPSFGNAGLLSIDFFGGGDDARDVLVQPDGKIVVVGQTSNSSSAETGLARILP